MKLEQIDTSTVAGKAEVMRLAAEGRKVASGDRGAPFDAFGFNRNPQWNWIAADYAIIAEPVGPDEVWVSIHSNGVFAAVHMVRPMVHQGDSLVRYVRASE